MFESEGKMLDKAELKRIQDIESKYYILIDYVNENL